MRAWLRRLRQAGVTVHLRHRWYGWDEQGALRFDGPQGPRTVKADAVILALGGGSWPKLGSDGARVPLLAGRGVSIAPLRPANCGFDVGADGNVGWTDHFRAKFAGHPVKSVAVTVTDAEGIERRQQGECVFTETGVEGGAIYALSASLRDEIAANGVATLSLDLAPDRDLPRLITDLSRSRGKRSMAKHLQSRAGIDGVKAGASGKSCRNRTSRTRLVWPPPSKRCRWAGRAAAAGRSHQHGGRGGPAPGWQPGFALPPKRNKALDFFDESCP